MLRQANSEIDELNRQLDENEQIKLNQFAKIERKDREIMNLKSLLRRSKGLLETYISVNSNSDDIEEMEKALEELDNADLEYSLPEPK